jgi:hypothetical protein
VGTKVPVDDRHDWAHKCCSARGMSGHESVGPLKDMFYPSSVGYKPCLRALVPPYPNDLQ